MDLAVHVIVNGAGWGLSVLTTTVPWCGWALKTYWRELCCALLGALVWTITQPLRSVSGRLLSAVSSFLEKWTEPGSLRFQRYRRYVNKPSVRNKPRYDRYWIMFEAFWATPLVVLEARGVHKYGFGQLLHKWLEAYHVLWCVFLPDLMEYSWKSDSTSPCPHGMVANLKPCLVCLQMGLDSHLCPLVRSLLPDRLHLRVDRVAVPRVANGSYPPTSDQLLLCFLGWCSSSLAVVVIAMVSHWWRWFEGTEAERSPARL
ncbi:hypothetical protein PHMEG_00028607, partial [Phytophthora megakarya]